ncbi:MAG: hypothetical protein ACI4O4_12400 [Candidatus Ventricola sp.]
MKALWEKLSIGRAGCGDGAQPDLLPGVRKPSFVLPYGGGEIWFEHLDSMGPRTELVLDKLRRDSRSFLLLSRPAQIGFVLSETRVTKAMIDEIAALLCGGQKAFRRVCFIGTDRKTRRMLQDALRNKSQFALSFIDDFEQAKAWLVSEAVL